MSNYDVLYGMVLRLQSENGKDISKNIDEITERLGEAIKKEFPDFMLLPFGMELVEPDGQVRIINRVEYPIELEEEDDEEDTEGDDS
jgi:hypothetical protein